MHIDGLDDGEYLMVWLLVRWKKWFEMHNACLLYGPWRLVVGYLLLIRRNEYMYLLVRLRACMNNVIFV